MFLTSHPAAGTAQMVPGIYAQGRNRRPTIGELVPGMFVMPQNPLLKSLAQVQAYGSGAYGPSQQPMVDGMGNVITDSLPDTNTILMYAGVGLLLLMVLGGGFAGGYRRGKRAGAGASEDAAPTRLRITGSARAV